MSNAEQSPVEQPAKKGGAGRGTILVLVFALLVVSAVCGYALFTLRGHAADGGSRTAEAKPEKKGPEVFLAMDPAFVVNFQKAEGLSYLQVGVTLMSHDPAAIQAAKDADPVIRNALVMLFSSQDYTELADIQGKQKLQAKALAAVQKILQERTGHAGVEALYFTSFVMQ
ncbi:flagellar basal body-associated FliL family protein [Dyella sp. BiH032]|uniref:flagellar basal body-associated FliL family protein n=1 Tax=Dyella sp. BiH032 TaxID=3075430 RepID=UPI002892A4C2|nr:flagellar basal body-associated FliL family protein [Dyella sp. BiH032]WNL47266.1 flagellar basal body-associated FliL family protein [Dyella sp. BiH032]